MLRVLQEMRVNLILPPSVIKKVQLWERCLRGDEEACLELNALVGLATVAADFESE